jgi:nucleoside-diphosphate-sugar epimerase
VENVAAAVALAATDERASGRIYNLGEMESTSTIEWVSRIGRAIGWNGEVTTVPDSRMVEISPFAMMRINTAQYVTVDSTLIRRELGHSEPIGPDEALVRTLAWERSNPISSVYPGAIS